MRREQSLPDKIMDVVTGIVCAGAALATMAGAIVVAAFIKVGLPVVIVVSVLRLMGVL